MNESEELEIDQNDIRIIEEDDVAKEEPTKEGPELKRS